MKRGQASAGGAVGTIVILVILIFAYIVLLPSGDRKILLGEGEGPVPPGGSPGAMRNVLLAQSVGKIFPPAPNEVEHTIPSFAIFTNTDATELQRKSSMIIKNGVFTEQIGEMTFMHNPSNTKNLMLSFNVRSTEGNLIIKLNGEEIFNSDIDNPSPSPVTLPNSLLQAENTLTFEASSQGVAFWRTNEHDLRNIIISGDVTDRSGSTSDQHFSISQQEYESMEYAILNFLPNCDPETTGRLRISVNGNELFSGFADCGVPNRVEIAKELLNPGDNTLRFISTQGQYLVDLVKVTSKISGQSIPVLYFNLPNRMLDRLYYNDALLIISLRFADYGQKAGVINLNGFETTFTARNPIYETQINPEFLMSGPNSIMVIPQGQPLELVELRVEVI